MYQIFVAVGNLGGDPEVKQSQAGNAWATLSVAVNERAKNASGEWEERAEWLRVVVFGKTAENCGQYLRKGSKVLVQGRLQTRNWEDDQGVKRWSTEVIAHTVKFLDPKDGQSTQRRPEPPADDGDFPFDSAPRPTH